MRRRRTGWRAPQSQTPASRKAAINAHKREMYHKYYKRNKRKSTSMDAMLGCLFFIILFVAVMFKMVAVMFNNFIAMTF